MKVTIPGLSKSEGVKFEKKLFPDGEYAALCVKPKNFVRETSNDNGSGTMYNFWYKILEAPEGAEDMVNRIYFDFIWIPNEDHSAYESMYERSVDQMKDRAIAHGVDINTKNSFESEDFEEAEVYLKIATRVDKKTGEEVNVIKRVTSLDD